MSDLETLLGMAKTAEMAGNHAEAHSYYNRVLEIEPKLPEAWLGKGRAAGWQSTLANLRLKESSVSFGHAIGSADDEHRSEVTGAAVESINELSTALYGLARDHLLEFVEQTNSWSDYLVQMNIVLDVLEDASNWDPNNVITWENIVHICKDNIEGVSYRDRFDDNLSKAWTLSSEYEAQLRARMDQAVDRLKVLNPTYEAPQIEKKEAEACFVATAVMGDYNHPYVLELRQFRDRQLKPRVAGRAFISVYYRYGPILARMISRSPGLARLARHGLIAPAVSILRNFGK